MAPGRSPSFLFKSKKERRDLLQTKKFETLYGLASTNKVKQWGVEVVENEDQTATIIVNTGYIDGKIREIPKLISEGKNIGRSNETTPFEQAVSEAQSAWNKKRDQNYELEPMDPNNYKPRIMLPMLAKGPGKGNIKLPCFIQPKFNGVCNLAERELPTHVPRQIKIIHHSRGGKTFETVSHLDEWVEKINAPAPLHGELYKHGWSLQKIGSYTKELKTDAHLLEYWVYDMAWLGTPFKDRMRWLQEVIGLVTRNYPICPIKVAPTFIVKDKQEIKDYHDMWVEQGYEGAMLKNMDGLYMFEFNSSDIEKVKSFMDSEFKIIGGKEGAGTDTGCIIYKCITDKGLEFDVRPRGSVEERQEMFKDLPNAIGKMLTVRYPEFYESGIPAQPVGIAIRDYE